MNRKHNPMVSLAALVLLGVILALACAGCKAEDPAAMEPKETMPRFAIEEQFLSPGWLYIITDTETGVQYLAIHKSQGIGLTQLLPGEG